MLGGLLAIALAWHALPVSGWVERAAVPIRRAGAWGAIAYLLGYAVAAVLMVPGSALSLAGAYLYGWKWGAVLVSIGSTLGAAAAFAVARTLARERVRRWLGDDPRLDAIDRAVAGRGARVVFLLRLSPALPYCVLNYALGLTGVRFVPYVLATWAGMLPGTVAYVLIGASFRADPGRRGLDAWSWAAILVPTLIATAYLGWVARSALDRAGQPTGPAEETTCPHNPPTSPP